jgi:hypothetical protein
MRAARCYDTIMASSAYNEAMRAWAAGDAELAKELVDRALEEDPTSVDGLSLRFLRANAYEWGGYPGGVDLHKAYLDYKALEEWTPSLGSEALVCAARVLFDIGGEDHREEIQRLCLKAVRIDEDVHAKMLLGLLNQRVIGRPSEARRWYLAAYRGGLPWGLRFYARSHKEEGHMILAFLAHVLASLTSPLLVFLKGARGPFTRHVP